MLFRSTSGLLALRARTFKSWGDSPTFMYFGGNSELRGYDYLSFLGSEATFLNAELRFPFIEAMLTPVGVLGGIRGVFFVNMGGGSFEGQPGAEGGKFKWFSGKDVQYAPALSQQQDPFTGAITTTRGPAETISGFRLVDARASYGLGLETFALGFPVHFDWSWKTLFNKQWEDALFRLQGGSSAFRKPKFAVWIGYDF